MPAPFYNRHNGYIRIPNNSMFYKMSASEIEDIFNGIFPHGGFTYSHRTEYYNHIGFDTLHSFSTDKDGEINNVFKNANEIAERLTEIEKQLINLNVIKNKKQW